MDNAYLAAEDKAFPLEHVGDLDPLLRELKDKRVVMLGESSHGTLEFYRLRRILSQILIRDHGFHFIAVEGDWPDAQMINRYVKSGEGGSARHVLKRYRRWPTWMWANDEIVALAEWMRVHRQASFFGLDVYSLFESIDAVLNFARKLGGDWAAKVERRYGCFEPFQRDEIAYAKSLLKFPQGCENEVVENLQALMNLRASSTKTDSELFDAVQNARVVQGAERYYRAMLFGDQISWNIRDQHMMDTLRILLEHSGEGAKGIVWAHNTHIGDYRATDMVLHKYENLGGIARQQFGADNVALVGFGTYAGEVTAGKAWGAPDETMELPPAPPETYEGLFHGVAESTGMDRFFLLLNGDPDFEQVRGHRAVGVVYNPQHENRGSYVPTSLSKRYDAFIFLDRTHALAPLTHKSERGEIPETWPMGV